MVAGDRQPADGRIPTGPVTVVRPSRVGPGLILAGLVAIAAAFAFSVAVWMDTRLDSRVEDLDARLTSVAGYRQTLLESWIHERVEDAVMTSRFPAIRPLVAPGAAQLTTEPSVGHAEAILDLVARSDAYDAGYVIDRAGRVVAGSTARLPESEALRDAAVQAAGRTEPGVAAVQGNAPGEWRVVVTAPIFAEGPGGSIGPAAGTVLFLADPRIAMFPILENGSVLGATGETVLVTAANGTLKALTPLMKRADPGAVDRVVDDVRMFGRPMPDLRSGFAEARDYRGRDVFVALQPVRHSPWLVMAKLDRTEALAPIAAELRFLVLAAIGLYLGFVGVVWSLWRRNRVRFAQALSRQEAHYFQLFEQIHDGVAILSLDGRVLVASPAALRLWGLSDEAEARGRRVTDFLADAARTEILRKWPGSMPLDAPATTMEVEARRPDGTTLTVEALFSVVEWKDQPAILLTGRDITERKKAAATLQRYHALADNVRDILLFITLDGHVVEANRAAEEAYGLPRKSLIGIDAEQLRMKGQGMSLTRALVETEAHDVFVEVYHRRLDGTPFPVEVSARRATIGDQEMIVAVVRDISERKRLEQQSMAAQRLESLGRLAGGVAHDFNNLLTAIRGYAGLAQEDVGAGSRAWGDLEEIIRAADRASGLTRQMLAFSRQQATEHHVVDLNELVRGLEKMLRRLIGEDVEFVTSLTPQPATVMADAGQIENLLVNLALNARDAMPHGGRLTLGTSRVTVEHAAHDGREDEPAPGPYVRLLVSDTGVGMTPQIQAHAFEPFYTTKEQGKGTGLGLSTCYGIVLQHRGTIAIESEPGKGASLLVDLPFVEGKALAPVVDETTGPLAKGDETILLTEDDAGVRSFAARVLRQQGYRVIEAEGPIDAMKLVTGRPEEPIDLLVSDVVMPHMSGPELRTRLQIWRPGLPTLFISGYAESAAVHVGGIETDAHILRKPFTPVALARRVREVLDGAAAASGRRG